MERPVDEDPRDQRVRGGDTVQAGALAAARRARVSHLAGSRLGRCLSGRRCGCRRCRRGADQPKEAYRCLPEGRNRLLPGRGGRLDRKSTRLNSSHVAISYAVFCLKKKKTQISWLGAKWTSSDRTITRL